MQGFRENYWTSINLKIIGGERNLEPTYFYALPQNL